MPPPSPAQTASTSPTASTPTLNTITQESSIMSPDLTSRFSQADTIMTQESNYTANTGGRARQSWRDRNLARLNSFLSNDSERASSRRISLPDGAASETPALIIPQQLLQPPMSELPATPVAHPDEPQSFFDSDSGSDSSSRSGHRDTIISRASSVRVARPQIVEHTHAASGLHRSHSPMIYEASEYLTSGSLCKAQQILGSELRSLTPEHQDATAESHSIPLSTSNSRTTTADTESKHKKKSRSKLSLANLDIEAGSASVSVSGQASTTALPPRPPTLAIDTDTTTTSSVRQPILDAPDTSSAAEALDTLPTPFGGFGSLRVNPLRSNPTDSTLHRAISAPPLRFIPTDPIAAAARANRKVTIRPSDLVITDAKGHHRLFRESVVSTPYPSRHESIRRQEQELADALSAHTLSARSPPATLQSDRFPSPLRGWETLFLRLALAAHEAVEVQIEIEVKDRSNFDDAALFAQIRAGCARKLLGWTRTGLTARKLAHVSVNAGQEEAFDATDFLKHLQTPKLGHRRKGWIVWLRNHQYQVGEKRLDATTPTSNMLGRMPFSTTTYTPPHKQNRVPQVTLHYRFSALRIVAATIMLILASMIATVLWVLVGPSPVLQAADGGFGGIEWRIEAQARVLTGLVLGVLVFLLGGLGVGAWVVGS